MYIYQEGLTNFLVLFPRKWYLWHQSKEANVVGRGYRIKSTVSISKIEVGGDIKFTKGLSKSNFDKQRQSYRNRSASTLCEGTYRQHASMRHLGNRGLITGECSLPRKRKEVFRVTRSSRHRLHSVLTPNPHLYLPTTMRGK